MRIIHFCLNSIFTDGWNYQENLLSKYHAKDGHDVYVVTSQWHRNKSGGIEIGTDTDYFNSDGVHIIRLSMFGKNDPNRKFKKFKGVYETLDRISPDFIFIHGVGYRDLAVVRNYLKNNENVIAYADNHADFSNSATNWFSLNILHKIVWKKYERALIPYVKKFYGVLPARVDFLTTVYGIPKDKCELLVMGADDDLVEEASKTSNIQQIRKKYNIRENDFLIITGGKIDSYKKQTLLLMEAVKKIENQNVKLIIFGSVANELQNKVMQLTDGNKIQYIGWIEANESYEYFAAANLVVFPGRHSVFWEQVVAQGIPMVAKSWDGTHHIDIGGNVEFLQNDSALEIRDVLLSIIDNPSKYETMKNAALSDKKLNFSYKYISRRAIES